jgi:uracil-DNA glycosylase family protein
MPTQGSARHPTAQRARRPTERANLELPFGDTAPPATSPPLVPPRATLTLLQPAAARCHACHLWEHATQTVFGEGKPDVKLMLVGEQPGDTEDRTGRPFVGPAGRLLDEALAEIGIDRREAYVTNVVKHFKWTPRGPRRIHSTPTAPEIAACRPWLDAEIAAVRPVVIVCLGATAARALLGRDFRVTTGRGELLASLARFVLATVHPSSLLRTPDEEQRREGMRRFVADLAKAAAASGGGEGEGEMDAGGSKAAGER